MAASNLECELVRNHTLESGFVPPSQRPVGATIQLVQFAVNMILLGSFVLCFAYFKYAHPNRSKFYRLHSRPMWAVLGVHWGTVCCIITGSYLWSHELEVGVPCWMQILATFTGIPFLLAPVLLRLYNFYQGHNLTTTLMAVGGGGRDAPQESTLQQQQQQLNTNKSMLRDDASASRGGAVAASETATATTAPTFSSSLRRRASTCYYLLHPLLSCLCCCGFRTGGNGQYENTEEKLVRLRTQTSQSTLLAMLLLALTPYFVSAFIFLGVQEGVHCYGCRGSFAGKMVILVEGVLAIALVVVMAYIVHGKQDGFGLVREIRIALLIGGVPALTMYALEVALGVQGDFSFYMLVEPALIVFCYILSAHQCVLAVGRFREENKARTRFKMSFAQFQSLVVSAQAPFHAAFCKHLEREHSFESMAFLSAVDVFERGFFDVANKTSAARMRRIISMYVGEDAVLPCNLSSTVVDDVVLRASSNISVDVFAAAKDELGVMLYRDAFTRFQTTAEFRELYEKLGLQPPNAGGVVAVAENSAQ